MAVFDPNSGRTESIVLDTEEFRKLWLDIKDIDKDIARGLRKNLTATARPITLAVRAAALAIPSNGGADQPYSKKKSGGRRAGLRQGLAAATENKTMLTESGAFGVRIRVSGSKFAAVAKRTRTLPRYMERLGRRFQTWRHPVFAHKKSKTVMGWTVERRYQGGTWKGKWEAQRSHPFLLPTVNRFKGAVAKSVESAFEDAARKAGFK